MGRLKPIGSEKLQGDDKIKRIMEIARFGETNKNENLHVETNHFTKKGADGKTYSIVLEKDGYYLKSGINESELDYIHGIQNKKRDRFKSYGSALKRMNLIFKPLNEEYNEGKGLSMYEEAEMDEQEKFVLNVPDEGGEEDLDLDMGADMDAEGGEEDLDMDMDMGDESGEEDVDVDASCHFLFISSIILSMEFKFLSSLAFFSLPTISVNCSLEFSSNFSSYSLICFSVWNIIESASFNFSTSSFFLASSTAFASASFFILSISSSDKLLPDSILIFCCLPVPLSTALTSIIPLASISNVTSICGIPLGKVEYRLVGIYLGFYCHLP